MKSTKNKHAKRKQQSKKKRNTLPVSQNKKQQGLPQLKNAKKRMAKKVDKAKQKSKSSQRKLIISGNETSQKAALAQLSMDAMQRDREFSVKEEIMEAKEAEYQDGVRPLHKNSHSGSSKRAYYRELKKVIESADVLVEVLDARDPNGCRSVDLEKTITSSHHDKKILLLLNKIDLVPREVVSKWLKYLRTEFPTIAFKSNTQNQKRNLGRRTGVPAESAERSDIKSAEALGADTLLEQLKNYARNVDMKKKITVGIIGYPNVGKSSVINSLSRSKVVGVGNTPGFTRSMQEIHLDKNIVLLDCPGIVFDQSDETSSEVVLRNSVKLEQIEDPVLPIDALLHKVPYEQLQKVYNVTPCNTAEEFLTQIAHNSGKLKKGGKPDMVAAARIVLRDWNEGNISYFTLPPEWVSIQDEINNYNNQEHNSSNAITDFHSNPHHQMTSTSSSINEHEIDSLNSSQTTTPISSFAGSSFQTMRSNNEHNDTLSDDENENSDDDNYMQSDENENENEDDDDMDYI